LTQNFIPGSPLTSISEVESELDFESPLQQEKPLTWVSDLISSSPSCEDQSDLSTFLDDSDDLLLFAN